MTDTANFGLPFIEGGQAQKHVTHNEALRILDTVIQIAVLDMSHATPPGAPAEGERYVVAAGATGAWAGYTNVIATWQEGTWAFLAPKAGWCLWSIADASIFIFDGTAWQKLAPPADNVGHLGVNTAASAPNLLSVKSNAALFTAIHAADGGSGDARVQISKETASNTASVFFSDSYSGHAEFGLTGDDDFRLKVSPDGATWQDAFVIDQTTANVAFNGFTDEAATRAQLAAAPIDALGALNMFSNGGFEGGNEGAASAITLTASSVLQTAAVVDGAAAWYRGSFVAAVQQVASPFVGGRYALKYTVSLAQVSLGANDELSCVLSVPGPAMAKLAFGTVNRMPHSLGFWFQAHRTGNYSGSIRNASKDRSYPFSFTVTTADTPQWISLAGMPGIWSDLWPTGTPNVGMYITICLAGGASRVTTAGSEVGGDYSGAAGTTNGVAATSDAFYIGNVISVPGDELPDATRASFAAKPRNEVVRTDDQSLTAAQQAKVRNNLGLATTVITNSLSADVALSSTGTYFDGPSVAQGNVGKWFASGTVTLRDMVGGATFGVKLWDGTTVIASAITTTSAISNYVAVALCGVISSPAGDIRISCTDFTSTNGLIKANGTALGKDSSITAYSLP
jgi:hypothetical protein